MVGLVAFCAATTMQQSLIWPVWTTMLSAFARKLGVRVRVNPCVFQPTFDTYLLNKSTLQQWSMCDLYKDII